MTGRRSGMNEKNAKVKLVLLFFIITSLCVPGSVFAADNGSFLNSVLTKAKNVYEDTLSKASDYKNETISKIQNKVNSVQTKVSNEYTDVKATLSGIKNSVPGISSTLSGIKTGISLSGIKNSMPMSSSLGIKNNALAVAGTLKSKALGGLKSGISSIALAGVKSGVPAIALTGIPSVSNTLSGISSSLSGIKSNLSGLKNNISGTIGSLFKNYAPTIAFTGNTSSYHPTGGEKLNANSIIDSGLIKSLSSIKIYNKESYPISQFWTIGDNGQKVAGLLNNVSVQQYYVDKYVDEDGNVYGCILPDPDATVKVKKSPDASIIFNQLINGGNLTAFYLNESMSVFGSYMAEAEEGGYIMEIGGIPERDGVTDHQPEDVLVHESLHVLRKLNNLIKAPHEGLGILDEEGCVIGVENLVRYQLGHTLRTDGSRKDDINNDGFRDGDGSYGDYQYSNKSWWNDYKNSLK